MNRRSKSRKPKSHRRVSPMRKSRKSKSRKSKSRKKGGQKGGNVLNYLLPFVLLKASNLMAKKQGKTRKNKRHSRKK